VRELSARTSRFLIAVLGILLTGLWCASAYGQKVHVTKVKPEKTAKTDTTQSAEPDKVLFDRATADIKRAKYTEARLDLQTLINTYPDSEYLAKAKLAIADSFYKEGGTSNLTQAVDEYKNFIVFFPFLDEAAYAQMQVAMCHYRMMEKADRDNSQAEAAEDEYRAFLLKYPQSPLAPHAEQDLRNVQEVLADGEYRIAYFYYKTKQDYRASAARLVELTTRYPLYSHSDVALDMLGNIYLRAKQASKNEDDKNHWSDLAGECYSRIVKDYPLSKLAPEAKAHLTSMGMSVPKADPEAVARMQKQELYEKEHHPNPVISAPMGMFRANPDVHFAARVGQPNLNPPEDTVSATEVLNQGAAGPKFNLAAGVASAGGNPEGSDTESVDSSSSDTSAATPSATAGSDTPTATTGAQIVDAPTATPAGGGAQPTPTAPSTMTSLPTAPSSGEAGAAEQPVTTGNSAPAANPGANAPAPTAATDPPAQASQAVSTPASSSSNSSTTQSSNQTANSKDDPKNESSSKKKKGWHKLIP
jgi:outer membrane protein assembly factor BamD